MKTPPKKPRRIKYKFEGYAAFKVMAALHQKLFPGETADGGTRKAAAIFRALNEAYEYGVEEALGRDDEWIAKERKRLWLTGQVRDV